MSDSLKLIYYTGNKKILGYLKKPSPTYFVLRKNIQMFLFDDRKLPSCEIRTFWIDGDKDAIEILNQCDYDVFLGKSSCQRLYVTPIDVDIEAAAAATSTTPNLDRTHAPSVASDDTSAVHHNVECDSCLMSPIVGFRYKCIQCSNYDLCQYCEAKHIHPEHMMVRMPNNNCPTVTEAYITGGTSGRRHRKRSKTSFFAKNVRSAANDDETESTSAAGGQNAQKASPTINKEGQNENKHHRQQSVQNFLSHLYNMMQDFAEGDGESAAAEVITKSETSSKSNASEQTTTSNTAGFEKAENAAAAAAAAATLASHHAHQAASKAAEMAAQVSGATAVTVDKKKDENMRNGASVTPSPSLERAAHLLDPQYIKTGIEILNNFSDMFAKMLDPLDDDGTSKSHQSTSSSNINHLANDEETSVDMNVNQEEPEENDLPKAEIDLIDDTDSENESVSDSFVKLNVPENKEHVPPNSDTTTQTPLDKSMESKDYYVISFNSTTSAEQMSANSSIKSNGMNICELVANLKEHVAQEAENKSKSSNEVGQKDAIPVYHADPGINSAVIAMKAMGFSNEGGCLTKLLVSVNGNISEALDLMVDDRRDDLD